MARLGPSSGCPPQVALELLGQGHSREESCTLPPAPPVVCAGPRPALVACHPLLLQGIQDRSTLPPPGRNSRAPSSCAFAQSICVITVCWFNDLKGESIVGKRTSLEDCILWTLCSCCLEGAPLGVNGGDRGGDLTEVTNPGPVGAGEEIWGSWFSH